MRNFDYYLFASTGIVIYFWFATAVINKTLNTYVLIGLFFMFMLILGFIITLKPFPDPSKEMEIIDNLNKKLGASDEEQPE